MVFHDVIAAGHARKAISAGVDGIIAVGSDSGGHAGTQNIISLIREIWEFWDGMTRARVLSPNRKQMEFRASDLAPADAYNAPILGARKDSLICRAVKETLNKLPRFSSVAAT